MSRELAIIDNGKAHEGIVNSVPPRFVRGWNSTVTGLSGNECGVVCGERDEGWRSDKAASGGEACSQNERRAATSTACAAKVEKYTKRINKAER